jgi:hypothetical protein
MALLRCAKTLLPSQSPKSGISPVMTGEKPAHAMADQCSSMLVSAFQSLGRRWKVPQPGTSDCLFYVLRALTESTETDPLWRSSAAECQRVINAPTGA